MDELEFRIKILAIQSTSNFRCFALIVTIYRRYFDDTQPSSPVLFVDLITEADGVDDGQLEVDVALLQVVRSRPQVHAVLIVAGLLVLKHGVEERVH